MFSFLERLAWLQRLLYELTSFRALGSHKLPAGNRHGAPTPARWWLICHLRPISFFTDLTPPTVRATSTALPSAACELTKPLS